MSVLENCPLFTVWHEIFAGSLVLRIGQVLYFGKNFPIVKYGFPLLGMCFCDCRKSVSVFYFTLEKCFGVFFLSQAETFFVHQKSVKVEPTNNLTTCYLGPLMELKLLENTNETPCRDLLIRVTESQ